MKDDPKHRELLKAMALGETQQAIELSEQVAEYGKNEYHGLVTALFCILLEHRFGENTNHDAIAEFVSEMRYDYRNANPPIKPLVIEAVIRASLGEDHLLDEISAEDTLSAEYQVIRKIVLQSESVTSNIDQVLNDAESLVAQWANEL
jgi:hypothetical protein